MSAGSASVHSQSAPDCEIRESEVLLRAYVEIIQCTGVCVRVCTCKHEHVCIQYVCVGVFMYPLAPIPLFSPPHLGRPMELKIDRKYYKATISVVRMCVRPYVCSEECGGEASIYVPC